MAHRKIADPVVVAEKMYNAINARLDAIAVGNEQAVLNHNTERRYLQALANTDAIIDDVNDFVAGLFLDEYNGKVS